MSDYAPHELTIWIPARTWSYREKPGADWLTRHGPGHWSRAQMRLEYSPSLGKNIVKRRNRPDHNAWLKLCAGHIADAIRKKGWRAPIFHGPVGLRLAFLTPRPKHDRHLVATGRVWDTRKPDGSNFQKAIEDAAIGLVYNDDAQIARWEGQTVICAPSDSPAVCATFVDLRFVPVPPLFASDLEDRTELK